MGDSTSVKKLCLVKMAQSKDEEETIKRENYVGDKPLNYKKWDDLEYESDEDDCHPNIEIGTWRRLKERMRKENGIKKKEPYLVDKWNTTTTNKKYHIDPSKPPKTSEEQENDKKNSNDTETKIESEPSPTLPQKIESEPKQIPKTNTTTAKEETISTSQATQSAPSKPTKSKQKSEDDDEPYKARSNPQTFLDDNLDFLKKYAQIKNDKKADKFIKKRPNLVHEASEGYFITFAVDRAVEGAQKPELARLCRRCLQIHNLVQSCSQQNVSPQIGVSRFFAKIASNEKLIESYKAELNKQVNELMERIEVRRIERLQELQDIPDEYEEDEKAPLGPGGLDPTEVLNSLPKDMQTAFIEQDVPALKAALMKMDEATAEYHMKRCIDSGLWTQPSEEDETVNDDEANKGNEQVKVAELD